MQDKKTMIAGVASLLVVIALVIGVPYAVLRKNAPTDKNTSQPPKQNDQMQEQPQQDERIHVSQPQANAEVSLPLIVRGEARGTWYFEASFPVEVKTAAGEVLAVKPAQAQGEWMTEDFVPFEVVFDDLNWGDAIAGEIVLHRDNPSGLPEHDAKISVPIRFSSAETMALNVYFSNTVENPGMADCAAVSSVTRTVPKTLGVAQAALNELLKGPNPQEGSDGFVTNIPAGTKLLHVTIDKGEAQAEFSPELDKMIGGSCLVTAIRAQIEQTLLQFDSVKKVVIAVQGKADEEVLQP